MEIRKDYYPDDMAMALCFIANSDIEKFDKKTGEQNPKITEITNALYHLMATAENPYNNDYFRTLWETLQDITEKWDYQEL